MTHPPAPPLAPCSRLHFLAAALCVAWLAPAPLWAEGEEEVPAEPAAEEKVPAEPAEPAPEEEAAPEAEAAEPTVPPVGVEEMVVTITKREEVIQDVAGAITAFDSELIEQTSIESGGDLAALIPSLQVKGDDSDFAIRGISRAAFFGLSPVAQHVNGVYRPTFTAQPYLGQYYDLQDIQVVAGPAGVLYGRNATAGAMDLTWKPPHAGYEAFGDFTTGNYDRYQTRGGLNIPFLGEGNERLMGRFSFQTENHDAYLRNRSGRESSSAYNADLLAFRGAIRSQATEKLMMEVRSSYVEIDDRIAGSFLFNRRTRVDDETVIGPVGLLDLTLQERPGCEPPGVPGTPEGGLGCHPFDPLNGLRLFEESFLADPPTRNARLITFFHCTRIGFTPAECLTPAVRSQAFRDLMLNGESGITPVVPPIIRDASFFEPLAKPPSRNPKFARSRIRHVHGSAGFRQVNIDGTLRWDLEGLPLFGDLELLALGGYQEQDDPIAADSDGTEREVIDNLTHPDGNAWVGELRLSSQNPGWFNWTTGLFYLQQEVTTFMDTFLPLHRGLVPPSVLLREDRSLAPFANVTIEPIEELEFFGGVRWNRDKGTVHQRVLTVPMPEGFAQQGIACPDNPGKFDCEDAEVVFRERTGEVGGKYFLTEEHMVYLKWGRGYKTGFTEFLRQPQIGGGTTFIPNEVAPESIDAWEAGLRTQWFDGRLLANLTGYHYKYKDLQVPLIIGLSVQNTNAEEATIQGLEADLAWFPTDEWMIRASASYIDAEFDKFCANDPLNLRDPRFDEPDPGCANGLRPDPNEPSVLVGNFEDLSGKTPEDAPDWKTALITRYTREIGRYGRLTGVGEFTWVDESYRRPFNDDVDVIDSYTKTDLRLIWEPTGDDRYSIELFVENLEDEIVHPRAITVALTGGANGFGMLPPRTYGVRLGFHWGGPD